MQMKYHSKSRSIPNGFDVRQVKRGAFIFRLALISLLLSIPSLLPAASPSHIMSQAMLAMMDTMGDLAHRFKGNGNWSLGNSYSPYSSLNGLSGYPLNYYAMPGNGFPGTGLPYGLPLQSPTPGFGGLPGQSGVPLASPFNQPQPNLSPVDGIWVGRGGEIVLVMYGHFRIYASAEVYQDGRFEISNDRLVMYDPESERRMVFNYYLEDGRMILRSESGTTLLFKQLPIPIPPYNLFANPSSAYQ
jgi:hypothetical protein